MSEEVLNELQLLTAMYDPSDVTFHDLEVLNLVENCIPINDSVCVTVRLNENLELDLRLPLGYPESERLSAHCRVKLSGPQSSSSELRNAVQKWESQTNNDLQEKYLKDTDQQPNILGVIQWCNDYFEEFPIPKELCRKSSGSQDDDDSTVGGASSTSSESCCRIWIFSHHIYNKNKRKFLVNTAEELELSGFSLPGKPGFVCVEGDPDNCNEYWTRVRQLTWQKISLIERQIFPRSERIFDEKSFEEMHCDKSAFIKFLEEKNVSAIIKDYLGI